MADGIANQIADGAGSAVLLHLRRKLHSFSHHYDGEMLASFLALSDIPADVLDGERDFRDQDDMSAAGNAGFESDPAAVAAHHFDHHHAMMRRRRGVNLVDGVGDGMQRGVKAERDLRGRKIVVDGLGHADDLHSSQKKFVADLLRSVSADGDDGVDAELGGVGNHFPRNVAGHFFAVLDAPVVKGIAAVGGTENGSPARQNAGNLLDREFEGFFRPDEAVEAIGDADDFPSVLESGRFGGGANDRVEAGSVPASGGNTDAANV